MAATLRKGCLIFVVLALPFVIIEYVLWLFAWGHVDCWSDGMVRARTVAALIAPPLLYLVIDRRLTRGRPGPVIARTVLMALLALLWIGIVYPGISNAPQRSRQKETMRRMRQIATILEAYQIDKVAYPVTTDIHQLHKIVGRVYGTFEDQDAWCTPFVLESRPKTYTIISLAKDRKRNAAKPIVRETTNFDDDIIFSDGMFVQSPEGVQQ